MKALLAVLVLAACGSTTPPTRREPAAPVDAATSAVALDLDLARPVTDLRVTGLGPRTKAARAAITTRVGDVIDPLPVRRDEVALWALGGLATLEVTANATEGGVELVFAATERPRIVEVTIRDATNANLVGAAGAWDADVGQTFDPAAAQRARRQLIDAYRDGGFAFADATWEVAPAGDGVEMIVHVTEGKRVEIRTITFRGNKRFTAKQLLAMMTTHTGAAVGGPYAPSAFDLGLLYVNSAYFDVGHVEIQAGPTEATFDANGELVDVVIPISEGAQHKLGKILFQGDLVESEASELATLGVKTGQVFNRTKLAAGIDALTALHQNHGKPHAYIQPLTKLDPATHTIELTIYIQ